MESASPNALLSTPSELLFHICAFLDVPDILSLRKTCTTLALITRDRGVWLHQLRRQSTFLPLPRCAVSTLELTALDIENIVIAAHRSLNDWPHPRETTVHLGGTPEEYQDIVYLTLLLDRLVLCVYSHGAVVLWDICDKPGENRKLFVPSLAYWELWGREPWTSAVAVPDMGNEAVYVAITRAQNRTQQGSATVLMRIPVDQVVPPARSLRIDPPSVCDISTTSARDNPFNDVDTLFGPDAQVVRTIEPNQRLLALSRTPYIDVYHWPSNTGITIDAQREDLDQLWNGIIGLQFVGPYLLCIKARTLELYAIQFPFPKNVHTYFVPSSLGPPFPSSAPPTPPATALRPIAAHNFPSTTFRGVSISASLPSSHANRMTLAFLAHDVLRGVFHYRVHITGASVSSSAPPMLRIELVGLHNMAHGVPGFVSAAALGPQGRRGVWVERTKNVTTRRVMVFSAPDNEDTEEDLIEDLRERGSVSTKLEETTNTQSDVETELSDDDSDEESEGDGAWGLGRPIDAQMIYEVRSYDLREDLLHVAFSEVSGGIALGTRSGDIRVI